MLDDAEDQIATLAGRFVLDAFQQQILLRVTDVGRSHPDDRCEPSDRDSAQSEGVSGTLRRLRSGKRGDHRCDSLELFLR